MNNQDVFVMLNKTKMLVFLDHVMHCHPPWYRGGLEVLVLPGGLETQAHPKAGEADNIEKKRRLKHVLV